MDDSKGQSERLISSASKPRLGIDIDGCIDQCQIFLQLITQNWHGDIIVISLRKDRSVLEKMLRDFGMRYTELILVESMEDKVAVITERGVLVFMGPRQESLKGIPGVVNVMLVRNDGNFDFKDRRWLFTHETGKYAYFDPDHLIVCPRCETQLFADQTSCYNCGEDHLF